MLKLNGIRKSFGEVEVLKGISFSLNKGETLGLVGENGAGKSTIMNILGGVFAPTQGTIEFNGAPYLPERVNDSFERGIAFIHQELNLFPNLSVRENLFINEFSKQTWLLTHFIDQCKMNRRAKELLASVGLAVDPTDLVGHLTNGQQQLLEIAKALKGQPKLIIFDEPTTALSQQETQQLFQLIKSLRAQYISMIFISHNLDHVLAITDKIAVVRDGALIQVKHTGKYSKKEMIRDMVGRDLDQFFPPRNGRPGRKSMFQVNGLSVDGVNALSFKVKENEVLGFYGLVGAGRSEMARGIFGLQKVFRGEVLWKGNTYRSFKPRKWIKQGVVYLTEDRREEGILWIKSVLENVQLAALPDYQRGGIGFLDYQAIRSRVKREVTSTKVKYHSIDKQPVSSLSGGNQQKVLLSRWLMTNPELLILDEPTKGIDIGAREEIYHLINQLVEKGSGAILISSEIEELLGMCDRIMVMNQGRLAASFTRGEFDQATILKYAIKATE